MTSAPFEAVSRHWPFEALREEAANLNSTWHLQGPQQFCVHMNPVFGVGNWDGSPPWISIGINPRKNDNSAKRARKKQAVNQGTLEQYVDECRNYFVRDWCNSQFFARTARLIAGLMMKTPAEEPEARRYFLHDNLVHADIVPFETTNDPCLTTDQLEFFRSGTIVGKLADEVLVHLFECQTWQGILIRGISGPGSPWAMCAEALQLEEVLHLPHGRIGISRRFGAVQVVGLSNSERVSNKTIAEIAAAALRNRKAPPRATVVRVTPEPPCQPRTKD